MEDSQWIAEGLTWWAGIFVVLSVAFGYRYWRWRRWLGRREDRQQILETIENADENTAAIWDPRYQSYVPVENIHEYRGGYAEKAKVNWDHASGGATRKRGLAQYILQWVLRQKRTD